MEFPSIDHLTDIELILLLEDSVKFKDEDFSKFLRLELNRRAKELDKLVEKN